MPINVKDIDETNFVRTRKEALEIIDSMGIITHPTDTVIFNKPTDKLFYISDLEQWFGRGVYIISNLYNGQYIQGVRAGQLKGLRLGLNGIDEAGSELRNEYKIGGEKFYKLVDEEYEKHPYNVLKEQRVSALPAELKVQYIEQSGEDSYYVHVYKGELVRIGGTYGYTSEEYKMYEDIEMTNFTSTANITYNNNVHNVTLYVAPFLKNSILPASIYGTTMSNTNPNKPVDIKIDNFEINSIILPVGTQQEMILGRDLLELFNINAKKQFKDLTLSFCTTSLLNGFLLSPTEPKTPESIHKFIENTNEDFYILVSDMESITAKDPSEIYKAYKVKYSTNPQQLDYTSLRLQSLINKYLTPTVINESMFDEYKEKPTRLTNEFQVLQLIKQGYLSSNADLPMIEAVAESLTSKICLTYSIIDNDTTDLTSLFTDNNISDKWEVTDIIPKALWKIGTFYPRILVCKDNDITYINIPLYKLDEKHDKDEMRHLEAIASSFLEYNYRIDTLKDYIAANNK